LDQTKTACTWAFVGKMIFGNQNDSNELPPPNSRISDALSAAKHSSFYDENLLNRILGSSVDHEIAWHSYYHTSFKEKDVSVNYVKKDLAIMKQFEAKIGKEIKTVIFPQNKGGYYEVCQSYGLKYCRLKKNYRKCDLYGKTLHAIGLFRLRSNMSNLFKLSENFWGSTGSLFFNPTQKKGIFIPINLIRKTAVEGIRRAINKKRCFHIWVHPFNFGEIKGLMSEFMNVLDFANNEREKGSLSIMTLSKYMESFKGGLIK
jgi:hypothetical protein